MKTKFSQTFLVAVCLFSLAPTLAYPVSYLDFNDGQIHSVDQAWGEDYTVRFDYNTPGM